MKLPLVVLAILAASMSYSTTGYSDEYTGLPNDYSSISNSEVRGQKDECLIVAKNCIGTNESVLQRTNRLQKEIDKGAAVYTPEELKRLQDELNWINTESGNFGGGY